MQGAEPWTQQVEYLRGKMPSCRKIIHKNIRKCIDLGTYELRRALLVLDLLYPV